MNHAISRPTTTELLVRPATEADWAQMWPIWRDIVTAGDTYTYDPHTPEATARAGWLAPAPSETWLALRGAAVLGMYRIAPNQAGPGSHVVNASYMVGEAARGLGVGRALVVHSLERARAAGYLAMQFNAVAATNVHAIRLYGELGFATIGTVPRGFRHPEQGLVDLLIMHREL